MKRWLLAIIALMATVASAERITTFEWNNGENWPTGTTVELCANDLCVPGLTGTQHTMTVPVQPGQVISAQARAVAPVGYQCGEPLAPCPYSEWVALTQTWPTVPINPWAIKQEITSMAAPTYVNQYATAFDTTTSPKTAMSSVAINSGDVLVAVAASSNDTGILSITENGAGTATLQRSSVVVAYTNTYGWTYIAPSNETITVSFSVSGSGEDIFGGNVIRFSGSDGVGASNVAHSATGSPSVSLTTTQANSAIIVICGDWEALSGTQTFTNNFSGTPTILTDYPGDINKYGVAIAYFPDAGAVGSKTVGMSSPSGQKWTIIAIEVKGTVGGVATGLPRRALDGPLYGSTRGSVR